jgi:hypothetical protein
LTLVCAPGAGHQHQPDRHSRQQAFHGLLHIPINRQRQLSLYLGEIKRAGLLVLQLNHAEGLPTAGAAGLGMCRNSSISNGRSTYLRISVHL